MSDRSEGGSNIFGFCQWSMTLALPFASTLAFETWRPETQATQMKQMRMCLASTSRFLASTQAEANDFALATRL